MRKVTGPPRGARPVAGPPLSPEAGRQSKSRCEVVRLQLGWGHAPRVLRPQGWSPPALGAVVFLAGHSHAAHCPSDSGREAEHSSHDRRSDLLMVGRWSALVGGDIFRPGLKKQGPVPEIPADTGNQRLSRCLASDSKAAYLWQQQKNTGSERRSAWNSREWLRTNMRGRQWRNWRKSSTGRRTE